MTIDEAKKEARSIMAANDRAANELRRRSRELEQECPHDWDHSRDPAGGPASWYCNVCGSQKGPPLPKEQP